MTTETWLCQFRAESERLARFCVTVVMVDNNMGNFDHYAEPAGRARIGMRRRVMR